MKRKTKAQREAEQIAALRKRIEDVYSGAVGEAWDDEYRWPTAEELSRIVPALKGIFGGDNGAPDFLFTAVNLRHYDSTAELAEWYHTIGVRA